MATADHMTQAVTVRREPSHRTWFVAAMIVLLVLAVVFGALWLLERDSAASLEGDLTTAEQTVRGLEGDLTSTQSELAAARSGIAALEAEVTTLNAATPVPHEFQAEVQALYDDFRLAIQDPKAEDIAAMFTPTAVHISSSGTRTFGAEAIGEGWESVGSLTVDDPGELIVHGQSRYAAVAVMPGEVSGVQGLLVTKVRFMDGQPLFSYMHWFSV